MEPTNNKAYVAAAIAALTVLITEGADVLPTWVLLIVMALVAGLMTWAVPYHTNRANRTYRPKRRL